MAGAKQIRAGEAFWEATIRDKTATALARVQARLKLFGFSMQKLGTKVIGDLGQLPAVFAGIGAAMSVAGGGILAAMGKSVSVFMEVSKHARDIGVAIAGIDPSKATKLSEAWNTVKAVLGAVQFFIGSALAGPLTTLLQIFVIAGVQVAKFVHDNQKLVVVAAAVGAALIVAGAAIVGFGVVLGSAGAILAGIGALIISLASGIGAVIVAFTGITAAVLLGAGVWARMASCDDEG